MLTRWSGRGQETNQKVREANPEVQKGLGGPP